MTRVLLIGGEMGCNEGYGRIAIILVELRLDLKMEMVELHLGKKQVVVELHLGPKKVF